MIGGIALFERNNQDFMLATDDGFLSANIHDEFMDESENLFPILSNLPYSFGSFTHDGYCGFSLNKAVDLYGISASEVELTTLYKCYCNVSKKINDAGIPTDKTWSQAIAEYFAYPLNWNEKIYRASLSSMTFEHTLRFGSASREKTLYTAHLDPHTMLTSLLDTRLPTLNAIWREEDEIASVIGAYYSRCGKNLKTVDSCLVLPKKKDIYFACYEHRAAIARGHSVVGKSLNASESESLGNLWPQVRTLLNVSPIERYSLSHALFCKTAINGLSHYEVGQGSLGNVVRASILQAYARSIVLAHADELARNGLTILTVGACEVSFQCSQMISPHDALSATLKSGLIPGARLVRDGSTAEIDEPLRIGVDVHHRSQMFALDTPKRYFIIESMLSMPSLKNNSKLDSEESHEFAPQFC